MLKFGYITELDIKSGMVRVNFTDDEIVSNPLPVVVPTSKNDKYSFPFAINEHVACLMDDNCEFGCVVGAIYSQKDKPDSEASETSININVNSGKVKLDINRQTGEIKVSATTKIILDCLDTNVIGNLTVTGNVAAAGFEGLNGGAMIANTDIQTNEDVKAGDVSLKDHKHIGAGAGNLTDGPQ